MKIPIPLQTSVQGIAKIHLKMLNLSLSRDVTPKANIKKASMSMRILTDGVISTFASMVHANRDRLYRIWIVSPWIGIDTNHALDPVSQLRESIEGKSCSLFVITRPPKETWHQKGIQHLKSYTKTFLYYSDNLHSKLYILECNGFRAAIFGSPNMTPRADNLNAELAIEFRTTSEDRDDPTAIMVAAMASYVRDLQNRDDVYPVD